MSASRDIHMTGFGTGKPRVEVGHATCKKKPYFISPSAEYAFSVCWLTQELKCHVLIGLETKSGEMKM